MNVKQLDAANAYTQAAKQLSDTGVASRDGADGAGSNSVFSSLVTESIGDIQQATQAMEVTSAKALVNEADMVDVVTAVSNAEMVVNTVVTVRDKVISAYNDILKMPI